MAPKCAYRGCGNYWKQLQKTAKGKLVSFHTAPSDIYTRAKWKRWAKLNAEDKFKFCSVHFATNSLIPKVLYLEGLCNISKHV